MTTIHAAVGATAPTAIGSTGASPVTGPRALIPFGALNLAAGDNATPALATPVQIPFCGIANNSAGAIMLRPGSVTGIAVNLSAAAGGSSAIFGIYKNGVIIDAAAIATLTAESSGGTLFALGAYTFVQGDVIDVRVRTGSGWTATTVDAAILVEIQTLT